MKVYFLFIAVFLAAILIDSCGNSPEPPQPTVVTYSNPFFPLEVGNFWIYNRVSYPEDTLYRSEIKDTVRLSGNLYYILMTTYSDTSLYFRKKNDTSYLRFVDNNLLVRYIAGIDSAYINFATPTNYMTGEGPHYPGLLYQYPAYDSTTLGQFDSCKLIAFHNAEPNYGYFVKNIGAVEKGSDPLITLVRAKIGSTVYP
jgi:hypothetical protein